MAGKEAAARDSGASADTAEAGEGEAGAAAPPKGLVERIKRMSRKQLVLFGAPILLVLILAIATFAGAFDPLLVTAGLKSEPGKAPPPYSGPPVFVDLPDVLVNLDVPGGEIRLLRASISIELPSPADKAVINEFMPRIQDALQTRLRALTPDDLRGSAQSFRLREELLQRIRLSVGGAQHVRRVLFRDLLVR
jgi:flagellar FliL protein